MEGFIFKVVAFCMGCFAVVSIIGKWDNADKFYSTNSNIRKVSQLESLGDFETIILGNSYAYSGIIPSKISSRNEAIYNLGIATAGPAYYDMIIDSYFKVNGHFPEKLLVLVSPTTFTYMSDNFTAYPIHRYLDEPISNEALAVHSYVGIKGYIELLNKSFEKGLNFIFAPKTSTTVSYNDEFSGYIKNEDIFSDSITNATQHLYSELETDVFDENKWQHFNDIIYEWESLGIEVAIFDVPTNQLTHHLSDDFNTRYNKAIVHLKKNNTYYSCSELLPSHYFRNIDHLNHKGAIIISSRLKKQIEHN